MDNFKCIRPTWEEMTNYANITAEKIKRTGFRPNLIIALSRGGLVPARMLCDMLVIKNCIAIKVDHWGITATKDGKARISYGLNIDVSDKKVLLVDDITDTGQSLELSKSHVEEFHPEELRTATLIHLSNSKYIPDFFGQERDWAWIVFPWNFNEDMVNLVQKTNYLAMEHDKIREELKQRFELDVTIREIKAAIERIEYIKRET